MAEAHVSGMLYYSVSHLNHTFWSIIGMLFCSQTFMVCQVPPSLGLSKSSKKIPKVACFILSVPIAFIGSLIIYAALIEYRSLAPRIYWSTNFSVFLLLLD